MISVQNVTKIFKWKGLFHITFEVKEGKYSVT